MEKLLRLTAAAAALSAACAASAQSALTEEQARAAIEPWYAMFNQPSQGDVAAQHNKVVADNYRNKNPKPIKWKYDNPSRRIRPVPFQ
jgi:ABC-type glycerol-3-phosphate transport system substrate-binding protein